ncbi:MAG: FGGY-family carbohydrate kinase, partial [Acidobacteriaceae bacterium]|nr:FGGY-family carbohydrate kinase [Acidobacteriaceae bacterium]
RWHQMAVLLNAASALDWVLQGTGARGIDAALHGAERRGLRRHTPFFLPYLSGERTPYNDPDSRGVFFGMTADTEAADLLLAVLEGVALAFVDGMEVLLEAGSSIEEICVTGGGSRSLYWGKLLASALNRPLSYRQGSEVGAAFGAARLARMCATAEAPESVCSQPQLSLVMEPDVQLRSLLHERRPLFSRLYCDLKDTFKEFTQ